MIIPKNYISTYKNNNIISINFRTNYNELIFCDFDKTNELLLYTIFGRKQNGAYFTVILPREALGDEDEEERESIINKAKEELTKNGYFYLGDNTTLDILNDIEMENTIKKRYIINNE